VDALTEDETGRVLERTDREGKTHRWLLWELMAHVANHGTQHRSEAAMTLTAVGRSPGDLDLLDFVDLRG
jgi:uncharacterized damage-inducible protein DinB